MTVSFRALLRRSAPAALAASLLLACSEPPAPPAPDYWAGPASGSTWQEVFRDDFDGASGTLPSAATWNVELVDAPFNREMQSYTNSPDNIGLDGNGHLVFTARVSAPGSVQPYTSARVNSKGHLQPRYGRIEARIKIPAGKGLWPAFWMLGADIDSVSWPACGETDIVEIGGSNPALITGSLHGPDYHEANALHGSYEKPQGSFADDFHVYALEWTANGMRWLIDEIPFAWRTPEGMAERNLGWIFDKPQFVILNLAVGGIYDGTPDGATPFPSQMLIDYVKVSTLQGG